VVGFYEALHRPQALAGLAQVYTEGARFRDPFNQLAGLPAIRQLFEHMFATLTAPRFVVLEAVTQGDTAFLTWDFHFQPGPNRPAMCIHGATRLRFAPDGRVDEHRDYWDAAEELYAKLPLLGALMRWLQRRLATPEA
jgi:hypothetical protein